MKQEQITQLNKRIKKNYRNIAGIVVLKNGKSLYEEYFNGCTAATPVHVFSVTKSILSALIGIAIDQGYIDSVDQKILDFFPDYRIGKDQENVRDITLKHMMTMTAPYKFSFSPYKKYFSSDDWVSASLHLLGGRKKAGKFQYAPLIGPDILSGILLKATGQSVLAFAAENLFSPLGISVEKNVTFQNKEEQMAFLKAKNISGWAADPMGVNTAGWGLTLTAGDMAKIGQMYLEGGRWRDKQIVSEEWIRESTKEHSRWEKHKLSYGYLWWVETGKGFSAMGDSGNVIYVNTRDRTVISIASLYILKAKDRIKLIREYMEPVFQDPV